LSPLSGWYIAPVFSEIKTGSRSYATGKFALVFSTVFATISLESTEPATTLIPSASSFSPARENEASCAIQ